MTRVLVLAGSAVERAGLEALLSREASVELVSDAARGSLAEQVERLEPDVAVLVLAGSEEDVADTPADALAGAVAGTRTALVVLADAGARWAADVLRAGVRAVLPRDATREAIVAAVAAAAAGLSVVHASLGTTLLQSAGASAPVRAPDDGEALTPREAEVLRMLAEGLGNKQIAARLGISEHTVKFHLASIFAKLHASTRTEAVMLGARRGLVVV